MQMLWMFLMHVTLLPCYIVVTLSPLIWRFTKDSPSFKDELDVMKFLCKDFWTNIFRKQIDNLRTNHQVWFWTKKYLQLLL